MKSLSVVRILYVYFMLVFYSGMLVQSLALSVLLIFT